MDNPRRRFTILDGMILVAAAAIAVAWLRGVLKIYLSVLGSARGASLPDRILWGLPNLVPPLVLATFVTLVLRSVRPRPSWRKISYQPGFAACAAAALIVSLQFVYRFSIVAVKQLSDLKTRGTASVLALAQIATDLTGTGLAVMAAWLILMLIRGWRVEPTWIDRLGRLIGVCWIVLYLAYRLNFLLIFA